MASPHAARADSYRPTTLGKRGMACSSHYLASQAGIRTLQAGGHAMDAAITMAAVLGLVEPHMSGPGGDGFLMVYDAAEKKVRCLNGTGAAPTGATLEEYVLDGGIPSKGIRSASVPGIAGAWMTGHAAYGRLKLEQVFSPAFEIAEDGFPLSAKVARSLEVEAATGSPICSYPASAAIFAPAGRPLREGEICRNPDYAQTLWLLARGGSEVFYRGHFAASLLRMSDEGDGCFHGDDLSRFRAVWQDPIQVRYRDWDVFEYPPNSSGHVLLQELNIVEFFDLAAMGFLSPEAIHLMVEAKKLAFADREEYLADPDFVRVPIDWLLSKEYAGERVTRIHCERAATDVRAGVPEAHEDTTCFCVADRQGNAVVQLQSIQSAWGSGLVVDKTGVLLNNRMTYWHLDADHVDALQPGKRVRHTMNPFMVLKEGRPILIGGTPGADTQVQTNLQLITHVLDYGLTPQEAIEAPRWRHTQDGTESDYPHSCQDELILEARFPTATREVLAEFGHQIRVIGDWEATGSAQLIQFNPDTGVMSGGADPRRDSLALAW